MAAWTSLAGPLEATRAWAPVTVTSRAAAHHSERFTIIDDLRRGMLPAACRRPGDCGPPGGGLSTAPPDAGSGPESVDEVRALCTPPEPVRYPAVMSRSEHRPA